MTANRVSAFGGKADIYNALSGAFFYRQPLGRFLAKVVRQTS